MWSDVYLHISSHLCQIMIIKTYAHVSNVWSAVIIEYSILFLFVVHLVFRVCNTFWYHGCLHICRCDWQIVSDSSECIWTWLFYIIQFYKRWAFLAIVMASIRCIVIVSINTQFFLTTYSLSVICMVPLRGGEYTLFMCDMFMRHCRYVLR